MTIQFSDIYAANRAVIDAFDEVREMLPESVAADIQAHRASESQLAEKLARLMSASADSRSGE